MKVFTAGKTQTVFQGGQKQKIIEQTSKMQQKRFFKPFTSKKGYSKYR
jgi:hypothetical protein